MRQHPSSSTSNTPRVTPTTTSASSVRQYQCIILISFLSLLQMMNADDITGSTTTTTYDDRSYTSVNSDYDAHQHPWDFYDELRLSPNVDTILNNSSNVVAFKAGNEVYRLAQLAVFLPYTNENKGRVSAPEDAAAVLLAIHHFNNKLYPSVTSQIKSRQTHDDNDADVSSHTIPPCNLYLTAEFFDTEFSPIESTRILTDVFDRTHLPSQPLPTAIVGAYRSATTSPLAILSGVNGIPQISYAATSTDFDNKEQYPLFGRLTSSSAGDARVVVDYFRERGVNRVGVIFVTDTWGSAYQKAFQDAAAYSEVAIYTDSVSFSFEGNDKEIRDAISHLKNINYRYFLAIVFDDHYEKIMAEAYRQGIAGGDYFWLFTDGIDRMNFQKHMVYPKDSPLAKITHGIGVVIGEAGHACNALNNVSYCNQDDLTGYDKFRSVWHDTISDPAAVAYFGQKLPETTNDIPGFANHSYHPLPSQRSYFLYDTVLSLGLSACEAEGGAFFNGTSLYETFLTTEFDGASGGVEIDATTGTRHYYSQSFTVWNVVGNPPDENDMVSFEFVPSYVYQRQRNESLFGDDVAEPVAKWVDIWEYPFVYTDGTTVPPSVLPPVDENMNLIGQSGQIAGLVLMTIPLVISLLSILWVIYFRKNEIVKTTGCISLTMVSVGCSVMAVTIFPLGFEEPVEQSALDVACMTAPWLYVVGFMIAFTPLFTKTHLMYRIYLKTNVDSISLRNIDLLKTFIILAIPNISILITWTIISPHVWTRQYKNSKDSFDRNVESFGICSSESSQAFLIALLIVNLCFLIKFNFEAFRARNIQTQQHETRYIDISMASILQAWCMGVPIMIVVKNSPQAKFFVEAGIIFVTCIALLLLVYVPKDIAIRKEMKKEDIERRIQDNDLIATGGSTSSYLVFSTCGGSNRRLYDEDDVHTDNTKTSYQNNAPSQLMGTDDTSTSFGGKETESITITSRST